MSSIQISKEGRRHYILGNTYPVKDRLRGAGCKWDPARKAWWTGKATVASELAETLSGATESAPDSQPRNERPAPGDDAVVAARATYKGRTYYVAGRVVRGRTAWDETVEQIITRDGGKTLLYFRDGSSSFWANRAVVDVVKVYGRPQTIGRLREFAAKAREAGGAEEYLEQRAERSGRCRGCGGPIRDARHHAAMGGYCGSCAFDEFDC